MPIVIPLDTTVAKPGNSSRPPTLRLFLGARLRLLYRVATVAFATPVLSPLVASVPLADEPPFAAVPIVVEDDATPQTESENPSLDGWRACDG